MATRRTTKDDIAALLEARHGDPFAVLGPHSTRAGFVLRALLPGAERAELLGLISISRLREGSAPARRPI